jgi:hypothetical protein
VNPTHRHTHTIDRNLYSSVVAAHPRVKVVLFFLSFFFFVTLSWCRLFCFFNGSFQFIRCSEVVTPLSGDKHTEWISETGCERCNAEFLACVFVKVCSVSTPALLGIGVLSDEAWLLQFPCLHRNYNGKRNQ